MDQQLQTVYEFAQQCKHSKLWLCPHLVEDGSLAVNAYLQGYECTKNTIPEPLRDRKVRSHYSENGVECIFWVYDSPVPVLKRSE